MGLYANLPTVALAPGMGQNAYFAFHCRAVAGGRLAAGTGLHLHRRPAVRGALGQPGTLVNPYPRPETRHRRQHRIFLAMIGFEGAGILKASPETRWCNRAAWPIPKFLIALSAWPAIAALWAQDHRRGADRHPGRHGAGDGHRTAAAARPGGAAAPSPSATFLQLRRRPCR